MLLKNKQKHLTLTLQKSKQKILNKGRLFCDAAYSLPSSRNNSYMHMQKNHANNPRVSSS